MQDSTRDLDGCLTKARAGSSEALGEALESFRTYLLLVANREIDPQLLAKAGASDIVQQTFLEAQRDFQQFTGDTPEEFQAWLRRLLLNNLSNFARHYRGTEKRRLSRERPLDVESPSGSRLGGLVAETLSPSGQAMADERLQSVEQALALLPEDYAWVILLRHREDLSFDEIAIRMNRSENAVRKLWFRAIERLQAEIDTSH